MKTGPAVCQTTRTAPWRPFGGLPPPRSRICARPISRTRLPTRCRREPLASRRRAALPAEPGRKMRVTPGRSAGSAGEVRSAGAAKARHTSGRLAVAMQSRQVWRRSQSSGRGAAVREKARPDAGLYGRCEWPAGTFAGAWPDAVTCRPRGAAACPAATGWRGGSSRLSEAAPAAGCKLIVR